MKTNKSYTKRLKITKNGKILGRKTGQNHNNSKESGRSQTAKGQTEAFTMNNRARSRYLGKFVK